MYKRRLSRRTCRAAYHRLPEYWTQAAISLVITLMRLNRLCDALPYQFACLAVITQNHQLMFRLFPRGTLPKAPASGSRRLTCSRTHGNCRRQKKLVSPDDRRGVSFSGQMDLPRIFSLSLHLTGASPRATPVSNGPRHLGQSPGTSAPSAMQQRRRLNKRMLLV